MNTVVDRIKVELSWKDKIAYLLLFLFPVAGMSVRHWISAIFTFLVLLSFSYLSKKTEPLLKEEKILLWIFGAFFAVFVITALANGWTERQTKYLGVEIRYLLAIPLYLMVRQLPDAGTWVLRGCVIGGLVLGAQTFYDIEVINQERAAGIYSPNLLGPYAVLVIFWLIIVFNIEKKILIRSLIPISIAGSVYAVLMSDSRGAFLGFIVLLVIWSVMVLDRRKMVFVFVVSMIMVVTVYHTIPDVKARINSSYEEIHGFLSGGNEEKKLGSITSRIEMWRASLQLIKEHPVLGIGRGNYEVMMPEYIEKGYASAALVQHGLGHPHNAFIEMLVSKGVIGFVIFMGMLLFPLTVFMRLRNNSEKISLLGIVHLTGFLVFSITDASTFIKGNYSSIFIVFLVAFFSYSMKKEVK